MQQRLSLLRSTGKIELLTVLSNLCQVTPHRTPTSNLPFIIDTTPAQVVTAIPLKPAAWILLMYPPLAAPDTQGLRRIDTEEVERQILFFRAQFRILEPFQRKLITAVGHVQPTKNTKFQHLFWRQLRLKFGGESTPCGLGQFVFESLLEAVFDSNESSGHGETLR